MPGRLHWVVQTGLYVPGRLHWVVQTGLYDWMHICTVHEWGVQKNPRMRSFWRTISFLMKFYFWKNDELYFFYLAWEKIRKFLCIILENVPKVKWKYLNLNKSTCIWVKVNWVKVPKVERKYLNLSKCIWFFSKSTC